MGDRIPKNPINENEYDLETLHKMIYDKTTFFSYSDIVQVITEAQEIFDSEPNLIQLESNDVIIVGDVHGNYTAFWKNIKHFNPKKHHLIMLGDYVDRGKKGIPILITICCMKVNYPDRVHILRGNHECEHICNKYGFLRECYENYDVELFDIFNNLFETLPIAMTLKTKNEHYFLCHGGISEQIENIEEINEIERRIDPGRGNVLFELLWNDPVEDNAFEMETEYRRKSNRGFAFGPMALKPFLNRNKLTCLIRAHECVPKGIRVQTFRTLNPLCITVFGVPNYHEKKNKAAVIIIEQGILTHEKIESLEMSNEFDDVYQLDELFEKQYQLSVTIDRVMENIQQIQPIKPIQPIQPVSVIHPIQSIQSIQPIKPISAIHPIPQIQPIQSIKPINCCQPMEIIESPDDETIQQDYEDLVKTISTITNEMNESNLIESKTIEENKQKLKIQTEIIERVDDELKSYRKMRNVLAESFDFETDYEKEYTQSTFAKSFTSSLTSKQYEESVDEYNNNIYDYVPMTFEDLRDKWNQLKDEIKQLQFTSSK